MSQPARRNVGRPLGLRAEPALRIALGYRDEERRGAPVKTDYFVAKIGRNGVNREAAERFHMLLGEQPRGIEIMLPQRLDQALVIQHKAWGSAGDDDEGGVLKAIGRVNFALEGVLGGPDVLTVWNPDGTVDELPISGVDDPAARELGVELYTTFRFHIPRVLGAAGWAEITSKGQKSTDNLFERLTALYGLLGAKISFAIRPRLILRPATGRPVVPDRRTGEMRRITSSYYALDIYVPETLDDMVERLRAREALLPNPAETLYGSLGARASEEAGTVAALPAASYGDAIDGEEVSAREEVESDQPEDVVDEHGADIPPVDSAPEYLEPDEPPPSRLETDPVLAAAAAMTLPRGKHKDKTIGELAATESGRKYLQWCADTWESDTFTAAVRTYLAAHEKGLI